MNEPHEPDETLAAAARPGSAAAPDATIDHGPLLTDSLEVGLAAAFGKHSGPPRSNLGALRPVLLKEAEGESALVVRPMSDAMPTRDEAGDRYQLSGEIARGGMGAVLRGRDVDLGRDLAVKVLLEKYAHRPDVARRFIEEAQIGGQLQHPGVVPIYDIGRFGDRPFFTMKLVKGETLAAILSGRTDPSADRPRLLSIALQVSQAMAYAHAKGVIHRDLKPANIMVGAFGEVQVMDWGLAKVLAEGGVHDEERASRAHQTSEETTIRTARSTGSYGSFGTDTEVGSILGTPAYMPPEQASGDIALLDRRADVFGLGAILCEVLTGKPPYVGRSSEEVRRKAANGDLKDALERLDACGADGELIALTKRCLAPEAVDRHRDAQEVADGLSDYLAGVQERLQTAERERAVAVARAEEEVKTRLVAEEKAAEQRKRRRVQTQLAAAVAALVLGGLSVAWWQNVQANARRETDLRRQLADEQRAVAENARLARNGEAVSSLLAQCEDALKAGDAAKAAVVLEAAKKRSSEGGAEKESDWLKRLDADLALVRDLDAVDQFRCTPAENKLPDSAIVATRTREALKRSGADPDSASVDEAAARVSASVARERMVSALDRLLPYSKKAEVRALLRRVDADPYRDAVRDAVLANDQAKMVELAGQKAALEQPPGFAAFLGDSQAIPVERRRQLLQAAVVRRPGDLGLLMTLSSCYPPNQKDGADERLRWCQAAIATAPANVAAHVNLGLALHDKGRLDEAIACYRNAIELDPKLAAAHNNLGHVLRAKGQLAEAIACCLKAIELDPKFAHAHNNLGLALKDKGQLAEAIACYRKAIALEPKYAHAHNNLGNALRAKGQLDEAITCYRKAIALEPKYANAHNNVGNALRAKGQLDEAIACYNQAIELEPDIALAQYNLGNALLAKGQVDEAKVRFEAAIELDPKNAAARRQLGTAERLAVLRDKLTAFQNGTFTPSTNEDRLGLAEWCQIKKLNHTASRLYADAFAADPKPADDLSVQHRYNAACHAALAAARHGEDATQLDEAERTRLRKQAFDWLRADLALWTKQLETGQPAAIAAARQTLSHWQKDSDLAAVCDADALAKLPETERRDWEALWAEVERLLKAAAPS